MVDEVHVLCGLFLICCCIRQVSIGSNQPAVKSAHLSGDAYSKSTLDTLGPQASQEYLISAQAAQHATTYHTLQHLKAHLHVQCQQKVSDTKTVTTDCYN